MRGITIHNDRSNSTNETFALLKVGVQVEEFSEIPGQGDSQDNGYSEREE
jgi:hypothetical protein